jgi:hypothetical protein
MASLAIPVPPDTTDVKTQSVVEVRKDGDHCAVDPNCLNLYHHASPPVALIRSIDQLRHA